MGMFDCFRSSYYLGSEFTDVLCQTKDLDCAMSMYWLDPNGVLWEPDYRDTNTVEFLSEDDPNYDHQHPYFNIRNVPTGKRGRISVYPFTGAVNIYRLDWNKHRKGLCLLFKNGVIKTYEEIS